MPAHRITPGRSDQLLAAIATELQDLPASAERASRIATMVANNNACLAQAALKFCLAHPAVSVAIPGIKTPEQAEENVRAAFVKELNSAELARIAKL